MPYGDVALREGIELTFREHLGHQSHALIIPDLVGVGNGDPRALLPPVLEGEKTVIRGVRHIAHFARIYAEDAAFLVHAVEGRL